MRIVLLRTLAPLAFALFALTACESGEFDPLEGQRPDAVESDVAVGDDTVETDIEVDGSTDAAPDAEHDAEPDTLADAEADGSGDVTDDVQTDAAVDAELDAEGDAEADAEGDAEIDGETDADEDTGPTFCTGVPVTDGVEAPTDNGWVAPECVTCEGAEAPTWELRDFQTQSCGYDQIYGLDRFEGEVVVGFLWLATCSFCQAQLLQVERMKLELEVEGITPHFVGLISTASDGRDDFQSMLLERGSMPFFQSTTEVNAWTLHDGDKDDVYIYGVDGTLDTFLDDDVEGVLYNLSTEEGYAYVRAAIVAAWERAHGAE